MKLKIAEKLRCFVPDIKRIKQEIRDIDFKYVVFGAAAILFCGAISALLSGGFKIYGYLLLPKIAPPAIVFPIVWTILYILIGGAAGAVLGCREKYKESDKYKGLLLFVIMMVFNVIWTPLFFRANCFFIAYLDTIIMIVLTFFASRFFSKVYCITIIPMTLYLLWLFFASYLNFAVVILN